uniref:Uncharacterized protein n=1 Tax=Trichogramma kaykai TaxID=54128 RepID=A0ABD2WAB7_9HYME
MIFLLSINYLFFLTNADSSVYILSKYSNNQLITSSTLRWISQTHYSESRDYIIGGYQYNKNITGQIIKSL